MSREITVRTSLQIRAGNVYYQNSPTSFVANMTGRKGPTPGAIAVSVAGTDVDFSELTSPSMCVIHNLDTTNFVTYGIWDPETATFHPLGEVLPGETYVLRLSRNLAQQYGTGTGTTGAATSTLRIRADTAACNVSVEAFEI